jgi:hypothetical protein
MRAPCDQYQGNLKVCRVALLTFEQARKGGKT